MPGKPLDQRSTTFLSRLRRGAWFTAAALLLGAGLIGMTGCGTDNPASVLSDTGQGGSLAIVPFGYNVEKPTPFVIFLHGTNGSAGDIQNGPYADVLHTLIAAHYIVLSMNYTDRNCYGNQQCVQDVTDLIAHYRTILNLEAQPYLLADSSGGLAALNVIASGAVHPRAMIGWCINANLHWAYTAGHADGLIDEAYNISDDLPYAAATKGHDPLLDAGASFAGTPIELWSSYDDVVVDRAANTDVFAALVNGAGGSVVVQTSTGNHNDPSNFHGSEIVKFFNQH